MKVAWTGRARRDLRDLIAYIAEDSVQAAERIADRILNAAKSPGKAPRSGRPGRVNGTRERVVLRTPNILVYKIGSGRIRVLRVNHAARRWPARFDR